MYIEAKCREPYGSKSNFVSVQYNEFYQVLTARTKLRCETKEVTKVRKGKERTELQVFFTYDNRKIAHFDIKQMLCHLLGIANEYLETGHSDDMEFWYLLYDPTELVLPQSCGEQIRAIYAQTCAECDGIGAEGFRQLFLEALHYLAGVWKYKKKFTAEGLADAAQRLRFSRCSPEEYRRRLGAF